MTSLVLRPEPFAEPTEIDLPAGVTTLEVHHPGVTMEELMPLFDSGFATLAAAAPGGPVGPGYALYVGDPSVRCDLTIGFPVAQAPAELPEGVRAATFPTGRALASTHVGSFDELGAAWTTLVQHPAAGDAGRIAEIYVTDPAVTPVEQNRTDLLVLLG